MSCSGGETLANKRGCASSVERKWPVITDGYELMIAWIMATLIYRGKGILSNAKL